MSLSQCKAPGEIWSSGFQRATKCSNFSRNIWFWQKCWRLTFMGNRRQPDHSNSMPLSVAWWCNTLISLIKESEPWSLLSFNLFDRLSPPLQAKLSCKYSTCILWLHWRSLLWYCARPYLIPYMFLLIIGDIMLRHLALQAWCLLAFIFPLCLFFY